MPESLSIQQARKLVLSAQRALPAKQSGSATTATLSAIEHLGYIQIDAISVIQRAHHHTLWNRNPRYQSSQLDQLLSDKKVFEYWSHAAAYLPMRDYRFSLPRKQAFLTGKQDHWYDRDDRMIKYVLERITSEGPLMAKDFEHTGKKIGDWKAKPAKRALEYLFMQGDLMVPHRTNFHKVYDLPERVLPQNINLTPPTPEEHIRHLITSYLRANGLGRAAEISYLLKGIKKHVTATLNEMTSSGELHQIQIANQPYFALPESLDLLQKPLPRNKLKILSPFDNLLIQRKRMKALFGFDYLIECYLPEAKRRYGYFSLPILWNGNLVARIDCKTDRTQSTLHIHYLALEPHTPVDDSFFPALQKELKSFLKFNQCTHLKVHQTSPTSVKEEMEKALTDLIK
ncbi:MAG: winged helix-turn-helix domain-containing protein [Verrucomicrobiaceae bacterium]